jgi:CarD family transcriptional regulator
MNVDTEVDSGLASPPIRHQLEVGARVFYPGHGAARVVAIEQREFGGAMQAYYVLTLEGDRGGKLMLPVDKVSQAGVRDLVTARQARTLLKAIGEAPPPTDDRTDPASRRLRATGYREALRSGSPDRYIRVIQDLLARFHAGKLPPAEQQVLQQALTMFVGEISAALDRAQDDVKAELRAATEMPATGW